MQKGYNRISMEEDGLISENAHTYNCIEEKNVVQISIIIITIITITTILSFYIIRDSINKYGNTPLTELDKKIVSYEKSLRKITKKEIQVFRNDNSNGVLYDPTKYIKSENPDITVVMTLRNQAHCIHKALRSVQNQSLKNLEIIIVDDCSLDNSTETVEKYMKEDGRIRFVKHETNEGIMITRNEAIRMAKGKYICALDADDTLVHKDILKYSFEMATMGDLDVVEFYSPYYKQGEQHGYYHFHKEINRIIYQPELRTKFVKFREKKYFRAIKCRTIWGKIVKNDILQKALKNIPDKYLYDYILGFEDTMIVVSLYQVAQSYYCLKQPGYYYTFDEKKKKFPLTKNKTCKRREGAVLGIDHIKFLQFLLDKLDDDEFGIQTIYYELKVINEYKYSNIKATVTHHFDWAYRIVDKLLNSKYITDKQRNKIIKMKLEIQENERISENNNNNNTNTN